jgi:hypothetical protein
MAPIAARLTTCAKGPPTADKLLGMVHLFVSSCCVSVTYALDPILIMLEVLALMPRSINNEVEAAEVL